jgi:sulfate transporter 4
MVVPQSLSYAKLAGLPVQFGLYSSLVPIYAYALFGTSRQLAVGPVALVSLLLSAGLTVALEGEGMTPDNTENYQAIYATMALQVAVLVGFVYLVMGFMKLGFVANFLSHAVISGFTSAAAIIIGLSQVKYIFGYSSIPNDNTLHKMLYNIFANLDQFNWRTFVLGTSCTLTLVGLKRLAQAYPKRFKKTRAAGPLLVTVVAIVLQATINLQARGIPIVGYIPEGLPDFTGSIVFPLDFGRLTIVVFSIVIVGFMESIAIAKKLAQNHNYELDANMELIGLGMANLSSGLFGGFPVTGSFSRSAVNNDVGAKSGISAIVTATLVAMTLLFLTSVFELLPLATLASIVISGVLSLVDLDEAKYLWRVHKFDFCVWMAAFLGTLFLGVELGLGIAIGISLLLVLYESAYPPTEVLGRLPGTHQYRNIKQYPDAESYDGIVCVRVDSAIYFANSQHVRDKVQKYYRRAEEELAGEVEQSLQDVVPKVQFIIMELSPVSHLDTSGLHMLQEMASSLKKANDIQVCLANPNPRVMHRLVSSGLADELGRDHIFVSLHDAIDHCLHHMDKLELHRHYESNMLLDQLLPFENTQDESVGNSKKFPAQIDDWIKTMEPSAAADETTGPQSSTMKTTPLSSRMDAVASENTLTNFTKPDIECAEKDIEVGLEER